jgi:CelD/BcsL family acetyltransferase involved in cellulose biosynthesis
VARSAVLFEGLEAAKTEWARLLDLSAADTVFLTPEWQRVWWDHFGSNYNLAILSLRDEDGPLGLAPLVVQGGTAGFLGTTDLFDYHDFVVPEGRERSFYAALISYVEHDTDWGVLDLESLRAGSPALELLPELAEARGFAVEITQEDVAPLLALPDTWDEYLAGLPKKARHELRRKARKLDAAGEVSHTMCSDPQCVRECLPDFFRLHRESGPDKAEFMTPARERFFTQMAIEFAVSDRFRMALLELDGKRVAACISFDYLDSYLLYNSGYDPEYSNLSIGILNKAFAIREAIGAGKRHFDFLRGAERYKYDLGAVDRTIHRLVIRR